VRLWPSTALGANGRLRTSVRGRAQFVAQVSNLPYRGFPIRALPATRACRLEVGATKAEMRTTATAFLDFG